jgi:hypothetical protein
MNFCLSRQLSCQFYVTFLPYLRWLVYRGGLDLIIEQVISNCGGKSDTQTVLHARWFLLSIFIPPILDSFGSYRRVGGEFTSDSVSHARGLNTPHLAVQTYFLSTLTVWSARILQKYFVSTCFFLPSVSCSLLRQIQSDG